MASQDEVVQNLWRELTDAPTGFDKDLTVVHSTRYRSAPEGWISIVTINNATVIAAPPNQRQHVERLLEAVQPERWADHSHVASVAGATQTLGPARLFYDLGTQRSDSQGVVGPVPMDDSLVARVLEDASQDERAEADIPNATSGIFVAVDPDEIPAAICGWRQWPHNVAHVGVLCARSKRGTGAAWRSSNQALRVAAAHGLVGQWRAAQQNEPSVRLAQTLGLRDMGSQLSLRID